MKPRLGILGYGRFGAFLARKLAADFDVVVSDVRDLRAEARAAGLRWGTSPEVASCPWIVTAVPIGALRRALAELGEHLAKGSVVVEVSSVKARPVEWLRRLLPAGVAAVPTHPLFGPDSAARSLRDLPLVVCPLEEHAAAARRVAAYGRARGLRVVSLDPETHDGLMARSQALTFFLSRVLGRMELPDPTGPVGTRSYRDLRAALASVSRDTDELYQDLIRHNRHARRFLLDLERAVVAEQAALNTNTEGE